MREAVLIVATSKQRLEIPLDAQPVTIGRHPSNRLCLDEDLISRHHCVIESRGETFVVTDLGSRNGTKLNGEKIASATMKPGDLLKIGAVVMEIQPIEKAAALAELAPGPATVKAPEAGTPAKVEPSASATPVEPASTPSKTPPAQIATDAEPPTQPQPERPARQSLFGKFRSGKGRSVAKGDEAAHEPAAELEEATATPVPSEIVDAQRPGMFEEEDNQEPSLHLNYTLTELRRINSALKMPYGEDQITLINTRDELVRPAADYGPSGESVLRAMLLACLQARATDLHIEPKPEHFLVRMRVDGVMLNLVKMHHVVGARVLRVVKVLADADITKKMVMQEGHFRLRAPDRTVDYRVSLTPVMAGQKLVIRVLDPVTSPQHIARLGLPNWMAENVHQTIRRDAGMILVCGPTGSGKTTTLYAIIRDIDVTTRNVITIEDPVEYQISGVTQIPINNDQGNTFTTLLRSVLRQDPDVLLLGEIRDPETARIAMQAAATGHLVLSTVHAKDTIGAIFRLMDLGAEPRLVASALNLVLAQRLVRLLCPACKKAVTPSFRDTSRMGRHGEGLKYLYVPAGCPRCLNTGYSGRQGLFELLTTTQEIRDVLLTQGTLGDLRKAIERTVFETLLDSGYKMVAQGLTDFEEVDRVAGRD